MAAVDAFLSTPELVQEMLLQLDLRTLLTSAQLVCRQWLAIIATSPTLQQALHLKPSRPSREGDPAPNPLLVEAFPFWYDDAGDGKIGDRLFKTLPLAKRRRVFMRKDVSWRRMLVAQPPVTRLGLATKYHGMDDKHAVFEVREFPDGLRMGELYDLGHAWLRWKRANFQVLWGLHGSQQVGTQPLCLGRFGRCMDRERAERYAALDQKVDLVLNQWMTLHCASSTRFDCSEFVRHYEYPYKDAV